MKAKTNQGSKGTAPPRTKAPWPSCVKRASARALHNSDMECGGNDAALASGCAPGELDTLPQGWQTKPLGEVCDLVSEQIQPNEVEGLPYVGLEHIDSGEATLRRWGSPDEVRSAKNQFNTGDILYGKLRPYLDKAAMAESGGICSTDILVFRAKGSRAVPDFLAYTLHTSVFLKHAVSTTAGVNHPRTSWSALRSFTLPLPPLPEQRAIAGVLQTVQGAKEACDRVIAATRQLKQSLLHHLFTYGPVPFDQADKVRLKEAEIGPVPAHWSVERLGDFARLAQYGLSLRGNPSGRYAILRMNNLQDGKILIVNVQGGLQYVELDDVTLAKFRLTPGDLLFNRTNSHELVGKTSIFELGGDFVFASYLVRLQLHTKRLNPRFTNYYLNISATQARLKFLASRGVSQSNINATKLKGFEIPVAPLSEQREIAAQLSAVDAKLAAAEARRTALDNLFKSLLHHLMTGQVRLPEFVGCPG